jgi:hypothetical protein
MTVGRNPVNCQHYQDSMSMAFRWKPHAPQDRLADIFRRTIANIQSAQIVLCMSRCVYSV